jgi:hypothetical protein
LQRVLIAATTVQGQTTRYSQDRHGYGEIQVRSRNSAETILVANNVVGVYRVEKVARAVQDRGMVIVRG